MALNKGAYEKHIKDLVNSIYDKAANRGTSVANSPFFEVINDFRPKIMEHFSTSSKKLGIDLSDVYFRIVEARQKKDIDSESKLTNQLNEEFIKLHNSVNHSMDFDFGFCFECVGKKTKFPSWNRHKLKKIRT